MAAHNKNYAISFARFVAMTCVVIVHFAQYYGSALAWALNFCVKMFFFISGLLYSEKKIPNCLTFYVKTAKKLLPELYLHACIYCPDRSAGGIAHGFFRHIQTADYQRVSFGGWTVLVSSLHTALLCSYTIIPKSAG